MHFEGHQVFEAFKAFFGVENPLGHLRQIHVLISGLNFRDCKKRYGMDFVHPVAHIADQTPEPRPRRVPDPTSRPPP